MPKFKIDELVINAEDFWSTSVIYKVVEYNVNKNGVVYSIVPLGREGDVSEELYCHESMIEKYTEDIIDVVYIKCPLCKGDLIYKEIVAKSSGNPFVLRGGRVPMCKKCGGEYCLDIQMNEEGIKTTIKLR